LAPVPALCGPLAAAVLALQFLAAAQLTARDARAIDLPRYQAPALCSDAATWARAVLSRLDPKVRKIAQWELRSVIEAIEVTSDGKRAALYLRGAPAARTVLGEDCSEVLAGAALIAAIAFGSQLAEEHGTQPTSSEEPAVAEPTWSEPSAESVSAVSTAVTLENDARPVDTRVIDRGPQAQRGTPRATAPRWALGVGAATHTGFAPWPAGLLDAGFELSLPEQGWSIRGRGSFGLARVTVQQRSARFLFIGGGLDVCPIVVGAHLDWQWRNCIGFDLGRLHAEGESESALRTPTREQMWWSALGLVTRLQVPRVYGIRFELEAGASAPLWRRELEFREPTATLFETPAVAVSARLGVQVPLE